VLLFSGKCDDVLELLMRYLNLDVPEYTRFVTHCHSVHYVFNLRHCEQL